MAIGRLDCACLLAVFMAKWFGAQGILEVFAPAVPVVWQYAVRKRRRSIFHPIFDQGLRPVVLQVSHLAKER